MNMKLFKNVDIKDLENILEKGILSLNKSENDNWDDRKRSDNSKDLVYLFKPLEKGDVFPKYGIALIECDVEATKNEIADNDGNKGKYEEYVTEYVPIKNITNVYIPRIFKERLSLSENILEKITWCEILANYFSRKYDNVIEADDNILEVFSKTAPLNSNNFNFFRGENADRTMISLYDVKYLW